MRFEWDDYKNSTNFKKHRIRFEEAQTVWNDPQSIEFYDPDYSDSEERFIRIGYSIRGRILVIVFCERDNESTIRIISARKITSSERRQFEKGI